MQRTILGAAATFGILAAGASAAGAQVYPGATSLQGEILAVSGYTLSMRADAGQHVVIDDRRAVAAHRAYGVSAYNHVIVTGTYGPNGRFNATAIRSYESREFAFRAHVTAVNGYRVSMVRDDTGRQFVIDDSPAVAARQAFGVHPGAHVLVEGKYGSDNVFRANKIAYVR